MQYSRGEDTVTLVVTFDELIAMEACAMAIYATPTPDGEANQAYMSSQRFFMHDFVLATVEDFDDAVGYAITGGWQELAEAELNAQKNETFTCTVPRRRASDEE